MPYSIRTKDGFTINNIPDNIPQDDPSLKERVQQLRTMEKTRADNAAFAKSVADPTADMGFLEKMRAGAGKGFSDLGRGVSQLVGAGPSGEEVQEQRRLDAQLMNTGAGVAGNIAANVATFAPLAMVPGANTVAGAGVVGALSGLVQPSVSSGERLKNSLTGAALGAGTQYLSTTGAQKAGEWAARREAELAAEKSRNAVVDETMRRGRDAGYVVPPSAVGTSWLGKRAEGVAGKSAIGQEAALRNQEVTDRLAREAASLGPDEAISVQNLGAARQRLAQPYREIAALSPTAATELEALKSARAESKLQWKAYNRTGVPDYYKAAQQADAQIEKLNDNLVRHAQQAGREDLIPSLNEARRLIAQNRQVQDAFNRGSGEVDAGVIGRALDSGAPLSGPLETIGRFQQKFRPYMREGSGVPTPGVSKTEALAAALLASQGMHEAGAKGLFAGGLPFLAGPTRSALLSGPVQDAVMTRTYQPGMLARAAAELQDPAVRDRVAALTRALSLTMVPPLANQ